MTQNRKVAQFVPIVWHSTQPFNLFGPGQLPPLTHLKIWCKQNCGVERADWECRFQGGKVVWRFRDPDHLIMFCMCHT